MSAPQPRLLETYNSLTDKHLIGYFSNARIRRHLQKSGLISRSGRIIPEKEYRLHAMRKDHQRYLQECLPDPIFHKHHHQLGLKRRLDYSASKERVHPMKMEPLTEEVIHMYSPHPPLALGNHHVLCPVVSGERTGHSKWRTPGLGGSCCGGYYSCYRQTEEPACCKVSSLRPNTAPGNIEQPPRLQPLLGWAAARCAPKASKQKCHALEHYPQFACGGERSELRLRNPAQYMAGVSPYKLPVIKRRRVAPVPPPRPHIGDRCVPGIKRGLPVERWFHPTTAFNEQFLINNTGGFPKSPLCSNALVTMIYLGKSKHVSLRDYKDEIKVYQQYCGTENICVYKGDLLEGDTFQFISKRYLNFPFSLTFYINGLQADRLSCCCEYKGFQCKRPSKLRRKNTYFRVLHVAGAPPCYRCILAMGLDKKLFSPKKKPKYYKVQHICSCAPHCAHSEPCGNTLVAKDSMTLSIPSHDPSVETTGETLETEEETSEEETEDQSTQVTEDSLEDSSENEYDEDFEADEEVNEEGQTGGQMKGMLESSSDDKNHNLGYGKESETSSQKALQASDSEKDESNRYSDSEDDLQERRPADSLSSMSTQCSTEADSRAEMMTDSVNGKEDCNIKSTSDSAAHAHYGNETGEKKLLRVEENQENSALEKKGRDEAEKTKPEDLTAREDTRIFHENIMAMQLQNPEVNGEFKQTGSGESNTNEEEKRPPVPWESRVLNTEDGKEEFPWCEEGGVFEDYKPVLKEIAKATGNDHPVNSDPEPGDLCANEEEKNAAITERGASGAPGGSLLAEGRRSLDVQEAAGRVAGEGEVTGLGQGPEQDGAAEGEAAGEAARVGDSPAAALQESTPEEGAAAEEHPEGEGAGEAVRLGTEVSPGEQEVLVEGMETEGALGKPAAGAEGLAGALPGWETGRTVPRGQEGAGGTTEEEEEAAEEGLKGAAGLPAEEEQEGEPASEAGESLGQGGSAGKDAVVGAVSEGEEAVEDADVAADGIARAVGPGGGKAVEEDVSEGGEALGKPGARWEALGGMETGEAMSGGEEFVKPSEFSQLKASEWMEMRKAVAGAAAHESAQAQEVGEVGDSAPQREEDTMEKSVEPDKGPVLEVSPGLGALGDPVTEGSSQVEETPAAQEEEGAAAALWSGNPSEGSKAETQRAGEGKPEAEVVEGSAGAAGAGSGDEEEAADGAAGSEEPAAGTEEWLRGKGRCPGEGLVGEAALPPPGLCGSRAGEPGLVAVAVLGGQAGRGALPGGPAVAGAGGVGTGAMAQEGAIGAVLGAQSGTVAEQVSATGRAAAGEPGRAGEGLAGEPVAAGRELKQEAAGGCEGRGAVPAGAQGRGQAQRESGAGRLGAPRRGEALGAVSLGERPAAETSPGTPARGDGGVAPRGRAGSAGGGGLCLGTWPQVAAPETGTARGKDGRQEEGMERAGVKGEGEQPSPCENTREGEVADVSASAGSAAGAGEPREDSPVGGSPGVLAAADGGERSRSARPDSANPDPLIMSSEQPQDGEETLL